MDRLSEFIWTERRRFETRHNNLFNFAFSSIAEHYAMLLMVRWRYQVACQQFLANHRVLMASIEAGDRSFNSEQAMLLQQKNQLTLALRLEVESFFLFAKILLDRVARAIELYFGQASKQALDSHDDLTKKFVAYTKAKGLALPDGYMTLAAYLKANISDFRDYEIAHEKNPRAMRAWTWGGDDRVKMIVTHLYPTERDEQKEAGHIEDLLHKVEEFVEATIALIEANRDKTALKLEPVQPPAADGRR